jgi:hypothetical protein
MACPPNHSTDGYYGLMGDEGKSRNASDVIAHSRALVQVLDGFGIVTSRPDEMSRTDLVG